MLTELISLESPRDYSEKWTSLVREFAEEQERGHRHVDKARDNTRPCEINMPRRKLSGGPWQSLGGYFDYSDWTARERFMELDEAIAARPYVMRASGCA
jgi:hypothetical protein